MTDPLLYFCVSQTLSIWKDCYLFRTTYVIQAETIRPNTFTKLCITHRIGTSKAMFGRCLGLKSCFRAENILRSLSKCCSRLFHTTNTVNFFELGPLLLLLLRQFLLSCHPHSKNEQKRARKASFTKDPRHTSAARFYCQSMEMTSFFNTMSLTINGNYAMLFNCHRQSMGVVPSFASTDHYN